MRLTRFGATAPTSAVELDHVLWARRTLKWRPVIDDVGENSALVGTVQGVQALLGHAFYC